MMRASTMRAMLTPGLICVLAGSSLATGPTFAPGTDPAYVNYVRSLYFRQHPGERYNVGTRWTLDTRRTVAYSFVEDGTTIPAQAGVPGDVDGTSVLFQRMDDLFDDGDEDTNDRAVWQGMFAEAFDRWGRASGTSGVNFEFRRRQTPTGPLDDPAFDNWDTGGDWATTVGPLGGVSTVLLGDIRLGMRGIDGPGGIVAFALPPGANGDSGNIILDSAENWADSGNSFRFLDNSFGRAIGIAIGMLDVCPENNTKLMEPVITGFAFTGPQFDDFRGVNNLYGDRLEPPTDGLTIAGSTLVTSDVTYTALSISGANEEDYFRISVTSDTAPENITITATPVGGTYSSGTLDASGCTSVPVDSGAQQDLQIAVFDSAGNNVTAGGFVDDELIGEEEEVIASIASEGTYYIVIRGVDGAADASQIYNLTIDRATQVQMDGAAFGPMVLRGNHPDAVTQFVDSFVSADDMSGVLSGGPRGLSTGVPGPVGHSAQFVLDDGYDGTGARYATVEAQHPSDSHLAFFGRPTAKVNWSGTVQPAVTTEGRHPTSVGSAAAGAFIAGGSPEEFFQGVAPGADLYSATVATFIYGNGAFITGSAAIYYALYSLTSPNYAAAAGLDGPVTVMNNSWGGLGDFRGDGFTAQAYDAVAGTFNTTIVVAAGNDGRIDNSSSCGPGGDIPGGEFKGARTIGSPATAFNVISVGAVGRADNVPMPPEDDDGGGDDGGGGGGGPGDPGGPGGGGGGPTPLPEDERPLVAIPAFSSKGPIDSFDYDNFDTEAGARSGIHLVAVGVGDVDWSVANDDPTFPVDPCQWTGNNIGSGIALPTLVGGDDTAFSPTQGTSFAAPTVAGAVALLQDVGLSNGYSIDPLVMKSILMTGAVKLPGWSNGGTPASPQDRRDGRDLDADDLVTPVTTQPLDYAQGAGLLNLRRSYEIYHKGITTSERARRRPEDSNAAFTTITETTTDQAATDPRVGTITNPIEPDVPTFPGTGSTAAMSLPGSGDGEMEPISASPLSIARRLREAGRGEPIIFREYADGTDPVLGPGGGGGGITFNPRPPFRPPTLGPGGGFGGGGAANPPNPVEVDPFFVTALGWDHGMIGQRPIRSEDAGSTRRGFIDYIIDVPFDADETFVATLCWNRTVTVANPSFSPSNPQIGALTQLELENLNIAVYPAYYAAQTYTIDPAAASQDTFNNVEHIVFNSNFPSSYLLRVEWVETEYDLFNNLPAGNVEFAVSWRLDDMAYENVEFAVQQLLATPAQSLSAMLSSMGRTIESEGFDNRLDLNHDGRITGADLAVLLANWPNGSGRTF